MSLPRPGVEPGLQSSQDCVLSTERPEQQTWIYRTDLKKQVVFFWEQEKSLIFLTFFVFVGIIELRVLSSNLMQMEKINIDNRVEQELQDELKFLGKEVSKSAFFDKKEDGTIGVNLWNVNAFLEAIKDQSWSEIKDQKQDKLWMTAVQIKLSSLGYNLGVKGVDGWFWLATKAAVEEFQVANWLNKDGLPGKDTITKLLDKNVKKAWDNAIESNISGDQQPSWIDKKENTWVKTLEIKWDKLQVFNITDINDLPKDDNGEYKRTDDPKRVYEIQIGEAKYRFFGNGRCANLSTKEIKNSKDVLWKMEGNIDKARVETSKIKKIDTSLYPQIQKEATTLIKERGSENWRTLLPQFNWLIVKIPFTCKQTNIQKQLKIEIDLSSYLTERGNITKDKKSLLINDITSKIEKKEKEAKNQEELAKIVSLFAKKKYSMDDLFWEEKIAGENIKKIDDVKYKHFFSQFKNNTIKIAELDWSMNTSNKSGQSVRIEGDNLYIKLVKNSYFQNSENERKNLKIPLKNLGIKDINNYSFPENTSTLEKNFRIELGKIVDKLVG